MSSFGDDEILPDNPDADQQQQHDNVAMDDHDDDQHDNGPAFIQPDDSAVEVQVDDQDVPMDDEDDETVAQDQQPAAPLVDDTSRTRLTAHAGHVFCVASHYAVNSDTVSIVSGGGDDRAYLHRVNLNSAAAVVDEQEMSDAAATNTNASSSQLLDYAHTDSVSSVAINLEYVDDKTPRMAAVGAYDGAIVVYDYDTGAKLHVYEGPTDVEWLAFHPKGGSVLLAGSAADNTIWMFHLLLKQCLQVFVGHTAAVTCGCFSPDGKWAVSASSDGSVRVWAPRTGNAKHVIRCSGTANDEIVAGLTCMGVNGGADGQLIVVGAEDGQAHLCHIKTGKVVASLRHYQVPVNLPPAGGDDEEDDEIDLPMSVEAVGFAPLVVNPNWCATGGCDGVLKIWDLTNGQCRQVCSIAAAAATSKDVSETPTPSQQGADTGGITRLQWHPTLPLVFTSCTNGSVYLWDARSGRLVHTMTGSNDVINDMNISMADDGRRVVITTACDDNVVRLHEVNVVAALQAAGLA